ncbi:GNAT family N-acetyltransferase [Lysinibacillus piscis]|uniref:GNAT family acetyltransferase n=1 Tax=Lysinibacillus piscis TaxID=2518931 RepID=A0ABQ5NLP9_9BACI|nr:GNAT family N-acetyltransferase [Lysinibacillus sp. KH24]GLC89219.1 GNAT family acetyltransferase [Lysinibacillus sp. KH24]
MSYQLVIIDQAQQTYRESFNELAKLIFDLDFQPWYKEGCWGEQYTCYAYIDEERVIANTSVSKMTVIIHGQAHQAIQIGTVMTHPDYRHQGLARQLMEHILTAYQTTCDFIYLFANETVLDFYPKFGFTRVTEYQYSLPAHAISPQPHTKVRKLSIDNEEDRQLMRHFANHRVAISQTLGIQNGDGLLMFYFLLVMPDVIYYIEEYECIVLFAEEDGVLALFDIISTSEIVLEKIIGTLMTDETTKIMLHFMSSHPEAVKERIEHNDDVLFIQQQAHFNVTYPLFPFTSHA